MADVQLTSGSQSEADEAAQQALAERGEIPTHIACIMDGNGRWAKSQGKRRAVGHREGVRSVRDITEACAQLGVKHLTLYTFSTENWERPRTEVRALMELLVRTLGRGVSRLHENNIRLHAFGELTRLPEKAARELEEAMKLTASNDRMTLHLALSYSGRWELAAAARSIAQKVHGGNLSPEEVTEDILSRHLALVDTPDPDLLIRTGGEMRISNYLLWQIAYTELYFTECFWPAFRREPLYEAIKSFQDRERRFGRVEENT